MTGRRTPPPFLAAAHLHVGHAMSYAQAEFIVRYRRVQGAPIFYPIGFDDNGINKAVTSRAEFRALCLREMAAAAAVYEDLWRALGLSLDWSRCYSTIDDHCRRTSQLAFVEPLRFGPRQRRPAWPVWPSACSNSTAENLSPRLSIRAEVVRFEGDENQPREWTMKRIVVSEFVSLDGVMEDPGGAEKATFGGWTVPYGNDDIAKFKYEELFASDALLLGRVTYEGFAAAWPTMTDLGDFADRMNSVAKYVVTSTLDTLGWNNSTAIAGDLGASMAALKAQPGGDILVAGSATLARALLDLGHVDEIRLAVYPVVLGAGKRLFGAGGPTKLELVEQRSTSTGVILLSYRRVGTAPARPCDRRGMEIGEGQ